MFLPAVIVDSVSLYPTETEMYVLCRFNFINADIKQSII